MTEGFKKMEPTHVSLSDIDPIQTLRNTIQARERYVTPIGDPAPLTPKEWLSSRIIIAEGLAKAVVADPLALQMVREMIGEGIV